MILLGNIIISDQQESLCLFDPSLYCQTRPRLTSFKPSWNVCLTSSFSSSAPLLLLVAPSVAVAPLFDEFSVTVFNAVPSHVAFGSSKFCGLFGVLLLFWFPVYGYASFLTLFVPLS